MAPLVRLDAPGKLVKSINITGRCPAMHDGWGLNGLYARGVESKI